MGYYADPSAQMKVFADHVTPRLDAILPPFRLKRTGEPTVEVFQNPAARDLELVIRVRVRPAWDD